VTLTGLYRRPVLDGVVSADRATIGGEEISQIRLSANGTPRASDVALTASARGFALDARARVIPADRIRIELQTLAAKRGAQRLALAAPSTLTVVDGGVEIAGLTIIAGSGRVTASGRAGSDLDLTVEARAVPLSAAEIFAPGLGWSGTLDGSVDLTGSFARPSGPFRARISKFAAPQTRDAGLPAIEAVASGQLNGSRATIDATVSLGGAAALRIDGSAPLAATGDLDLGVRGTVDAAIVNRRLAVGGRRVTGRVAVDARIAGALDRPEAAGTATLTGGSYSDAALGVQLDNMRARLVARGRNVAVEGASASTGNGGQINAAGRIELDPAEGFPGTIRITGQRAQLVQSAFATAIADLDLSVTGPFARAPRIAGRIGVVSLDVSVPERLPASIQPLPGTKHIRPTRAAAARLAIQEQANRRRGQGPAFDAALDLTITAPGRILVHGRGLNAELGGDLRLTGTLANPVPIGAFRLRQGRLEILTARLDLTRGNLTFSGDLSPELDLQATTTAGGASLSVTVTGPASEPQFAFTSSPDLPPDEVLSRLLFGTPSGQLSTGQALALAQAAAQYSGAGAFEELRRSLGLAGVDINLGASGGPAVGISRALNSRISVGVKAGAGAGQTAVGVDVNLGRGFKLQGEAGAQGSVSVGIGAEREW
jgi:translocation and assembly module TamB